MDWLWMAVISVGAIVVIAMVSRGKGPSERPRLFRLHETLFTPAERSYLGVLDQACAGRYRVFGKVRIADVISPAKGLDNSARASAFNRIKAKHFDFVLCDPQTLCVKAVIELNDKSHAKNHRIERDEFVRQTCADVGLALRMVKAQKSYSLDAVKAMVSEIGVELKADPEAAWVA